jgi:hypothetical protein
MMTRMFGLSALRACAGSPKGKTLNPSVINPVVFQPIPNPSDSLPAHLQDAFFSWANYVIEERLSNTIDVNER